MLYTSTPQGAENKFCNFRPFSNTAGVQPPLKFRVDYNINVMNNSVGEITSHPSSRKDSSQMLDTNHMTLFITNI